MSAGVAAIRRGQAAGMISDYVALTKPGIILLLELTTFAAMVVAAHGWPGFPVVLWTMTAGALASGGAGAVNCWYDRDIDASMARTRRRPIPDGRIDPSAALWFGIVLGTVAVLELAVLVNLLAAAMCLAGYLAYVLLYTMYLKRNTVQNIVVGGVAGAIPPLVGWAAVTGRLDLTAFFMFALVFYWTPPHFWSLALLIQSDYRRADVPMLPAVVGSGETRRQILLWTLLLVAVSVLPFVAGSFGFGYLVAAMALGALFVALALRAVRLGTSRSARQVFYYSLIYLAAIFVVMVVVSTV